MAAILMRFEAALGLDEIEDAPSERTELSGRSFERVRLGRDDFLGFYDWLRDLSGNLVGFRLWIDPAASALTEVVPRRPYWTAHGGIMTVWFSDARDIDAEASADQDFGFTRVFMTRAGDVVLYVDATGLSDDELSGMRLK